jgi:uncharacterized metal-binding protein
MSLSFDQFMAIIQVVLLPLLALLISEIKKMRESVQSLNVTMGIAITRIAHVESDHMRVEADHGRRIARLEEII